MIKLFLKNRPWHLWNREFIILVFCLLVSLVTVASNRYHWSRWDFGDAQTMLTLRHWHEGGWLQNYLLFIPQGYAKVIRILDEPALRPHAHGISPNSSPNVGPRLWYTHFPSGYLVPYAFLYELGLKSIFFMRAFSIFLSLAALVFMYITV